jgi:ribosomal-protein-alanine N-acetyltransferase
VDARARASAHGDDAASGVRVEEPGPRHREEFLAAVRRSRRLHGSWITPPRDRAHYGAFLARIAHPSHRGFFVMAPSGAIAGVVNISEIVRGNFLSAYLGYYAFAPHSRRGYMTEGLRLVVTEAFGSLGLHRVEANIQPDNLASKRLVRRLGFRREGLSLRYLKISGRWRDHERWAITREEWSTRARRARRASHGAR